MVSKQRGFLSTAGLVAVVMSLLFVFSLVFGIWAFMGRQDYKNNVDEKIGAANKIAVAEAEDKKDAEFAELEKSPNRVYTGPSTFGSITFSYPKTWSLLAQENVRGVSLDVYGFPIVIPGIDDETQHAFRLEVLERAYDTELATYEKELQNGTLGASAYRPALVPSILGTRLDGEIEKGVQGSLVLLPLRDKTIKIYSESPQFASDFNQLLATLTFVP